MFNAFYQKLLIAEFYTPSHP